MIYLYIMLAIVILLILLTLLIPLKLVINYKINTSFNNEKKIENINLLSHMDLFILGFLKIKRIDINQKRQSNNDSKNNNKSSTSVIVFDTVYKLFLDYINYKKTNETLINKKDFEKILKNIYFKKIDLNIGLNLQEVIINAYAISFLNAVINMFFAKNLDRINLEDTTYNTYISNSIINLKIDSIIQLKTMHTIIIILKIIFKFRKVAKKNVKSTSNRKFNDDSYELN